MAGAYWLPRSPEAPTLWRPRWPVTHQKLASGQQLVASAPHCTTKSRVSLRRELLESLLAELLRSPMDHGREPTGAGSGSDAARWRVQ
jgi:hypothetical protein